MNTQTETENLNENSYVFENWDDFEIEFPESIYDWNFQYSYTVNDKTYLLYQPTVKNTIYNSETYYVEVIE